MCNKDYSLYIHTHYTHLRLADWSWCYMFAGKYYMQSVMYIMWCHLWSRGHSHRWFWFVWLRQRYRMHLDDCCIWIYYDHSYIYRAWYWVWAWLCIHQFMLRPKMHRHGLHNSHFREVQQGTDIHSRIRVHARALYIWHVEFKRWLQSELEDTVYTATCKLVFCSTYTIHILPFS